MKFFRVIHKKSRELDTSVRSFPQGRGEYQVRGGAKGTGKIYFAVEWSGALGSEAAEKTVNAWLHKHADGRTVYWEDPDRLPTEPGRVWEWVSLRRDGEVNCDDADGWQEYKKESDEGWPI